MRIFIIGSNKELSQEKIIDFTNFCRNIGKELTKYPITLILCSPFEDSADKNIFNGLKENMSLKLNLELHYPKQQEIENKWTEIIQSTNLISTQVRHIKHPGELDIHEGQKFAWLYSQIQALNGCDLVIVVGGRLDGSANLLLRLAEAEEKVIVPIETFEGLSQHIFYRNYYKLLDIWADDICLLQEKETYSLLIKRIFSDPKGINKNVTVNNDPIFFLSYPKARPSEADFIEMHLRRRGLTVIRDDNDLNESVDISNAIQESIYKADIFIALWCKEYACSPWCYDELTIALNKKQKDDNIIWILCLDETRIVHPGARNLLHFKTATRSEIEGRLSLLLGKFLNNA